MLSLVLASGLAACGPMSDPTAPLSNASLSKGVKVGDPRLPFPPIVTIPVIPPEVESLSP